LSDTWIAWGVELTVKQVACKPRVIGLLAVHSHTLNLRIPVIAVSRHCVLRNVRDQVRVMVGPVGELISERIV
jgi:hypothetical protein